MTDGTPAIRVLVVEDDPQLRRALVITLRAHHYLTEAVADGAAALRATAVRPPHAAVLDLGLPDMSGIEVITALRGWTRLPVLVLSARTTSGEKVAALDAGADDYLTKPFSTEELLARLRAAVRRSRGLPAGAGAAVVTTRGFTVDLAAGRVTRGGRDVRLTPTEWHLLELLAGSPGRLVTRHRLLREVWGPGLVGRTNYLRVYMARLRRKLEDDPAHPRHLVTEPGMGYRFEE